MGNDRRSETLAWCRQGIQAQAQLLVSAAADRNRVRTFRIRATAWYAMTRAMASATAGSSQYHPPVARMIAPATATSAAAAASAMVSSRTAATDRSPSPASPSSPSYWCTAESNCVVFAFAALRASGRWRFLGPQATALCQASSIAGLGLGSRFGFVSQRSGWCAGPATTRRRRRSRRGRNRRRPGGGGSRESGSPADNARLP